MNLRKAISSLLLLLPVLLLAVSGCDGINKKPKTDWTLKPKRESKSPYGLYLAHNSLPQLFPGAEQENLKASYRLNNLGYQVRKHKGNALIMLIGLGLNFNDGEIDSLIGLVENGHQVVLVANRFDDQLLARLGIAETRGKEQITVKTETVHLGDKDNRTQSFTATYRDYSLYRHFVFNDTVTGYSYALGTNEDRKPNFIVYSIGKGKLFLHSAPMAFTNYFLLQSGNRHYLNTLFSYVSAPISQIYWSDFYYRETNNSDWDVIWKNRSTRYALLLAIFALGVYLLFQVKRRQKIIPIIPPVENSSVAFVETIGRLYYNKKNHGNLAAKMVQHFFDFVRNNYYLNTNVLDTEFSRHLAAKSGKDIATVDSLMYNIKEVQNGIPVDEAFLYSLYTQIQQFYNGK